MFSLPRSSRVLVASLATLTTALLATAGAGFAASSSSAAPAASNDTLIVLTSHIARALNLDGTAANDPAQWLIGRNTAGKLHEQRTKNVALTMIESVKRCFHRGRNCVTIARAHPALNRIPAIAAPPRLEVKCFAPLSGDEPCSP